MKTTGASVKLGILGWFCLFTVVSIVVSCQVRFDRTTGCVAVFTDVSGLRARQFCPRCGGGVGKVSNGGDRDRRDRRVCGGLQPWITRCAG